MTCFIDKLLYDRMAPEKLSEAIRRDFGDKYRMETSQAEACPVYAVGDRTAIVARHACGGRMYTQTVPANAWHFVIKRNLSHGPEDDCELITCAPGSRYDLVWPEGEFVISTRLNESAVEHERRMQWLKLPRTGTTSMRLGAVDRRRLTGLIDSFVQRNGFGSSPRARECWIGVFLCEISSTTNEAWAPSGMPAMVSEIDYFIHEHIDGDFCVNDIVTRFGVSSRQLHYWFKKQFGASPVSYLRKLKYGRARDELLHAGHGRITVSEVAARWGFFEMSHFARQYRNLFGELPSETLSRGVAAWLSGCRLQGHSFVSAGESRNALTMRA